MQGSGTYSITSSTQITFSAGVPLNTRVDFLVMNIAGTIASTTTDAGLVTYQPAGTSNVTNVETKLREFVSVKDFGAVGNGTTDDTAAFNAAWAATDPQAVYVPAASYAITGTVTGKFFSFGAVTVVGGTVTTITNLVP
jgi:polygalacturonase